MYNFGCCAHQISTSQTLPYIIYEEPLQHSHFAAFPPFTQVFHPKTPAKAGKTKACENFLVPKKTAFEDPKPSRSSRKPGSSSMMAAEVTLFCNARVSGVIPMASDPSSRRPPLSFGAELRSETGGGLSKMQEHGQTNINETILKQDKMF